MEIDYEPLPGGYKQFLREIKASKEGMPIYGLGMEIAGGQVPDERRLHLSYGEMGPAALGIIATVIVGPPFWVWASLCLQEKRANMEMGRAMKRIRMIEEVRKIIPMADMAEDLVDRTLAAIAERDGDDPALKGILEAAERFGSVVGSVVGASKGISGTQVVAKKARKGRKAPDKPQIAP